MKSKAGAGKRGGKAHPCTASRKGEDETVAVAGEPFPELKIPEQACSRHHHSITSKLGFHELRNSIYRQPWVTGQPRSWE
jgi:hypothetical protein